MTFLLQQRLDMGWVVSILITNNDTSTDICHTVWLNFKKNFKILI